MKQQDALQNEIDQISVHENVLNNMRELCYTASETEIIPFGFHGDIDLINMIKLVKLSEKLMRVPSKLRM